MSEDTTTTLTTAEVREELNERGARVSQESVQRWCRKGLVPGARQLANRQWRIPRQSVEALMKIVASEILWSR